MITNNEDFITITSHIRFDIVNIVLAILFVIGLLLFLYSYKKGFNPINSGLTIIFILMPILTIISFYPHVIQHERYEKYEKLANSLVYAGDIDIDPHNQEKLPLPGEEVPIDIFVRWNTKDLQCKLKGEGKPVFFTGQWELKLDCGKEKLSNPFKRNIIDESLVKEKFCHYGHCHYILKSW